MTFYIPEFLCGVIATVVFEVCMVIVAAVISTHGNDKEKRKESEEKVDGAVGTYDGRWGWNENAEELNR